MVCSVSLCGRLGSLLSGGALRYVEIDRVIASSNGGQYEVDKIPVKCFGGKGSRFLNAPEGSLIFLKGRLQTDKELGVYVISEIQEIYSCLKSI